MENLRRKIKQKSWKLKFPILNKKHSGKSLQQTRTSGRQNLRVQR
jgi:hypothetical protein